MSSKKVVVGKSQAGDEKGRFGGDEPLTAMATCPKGLEAALAKELCSLGAINVQESVASVFFSADLKGIYHVLSWARIPNRVILVLLRESISSVEQYRELTSAITWENYFEADSSLMVAFNGTNREIRNSRFGAQLTKDCIQDRFNTLARSRPQQTLKILPRIRVDLDNPDVRIYARVFKQRYVLGLDLVGESLHRRGYRRVQGVASLKENLAAALLQMAGWVAPSDSTPGAEKNVLVHSLVDPCCGSGTFLVEAALIALQIAPTYLRDPLNWMHPKLKIYDDEAWQAVRVPIESRTEELRAQQFAPLKIAGKPAAELIEVEDRPVQLFGADIDPRSMEAARQNVRASLLDDCIELKQCDVADLQLPESLNVPDVSGNRLLISNPPYGERLGDEESLIVLYSALGDFLRRSCDGWEAAILTGNPQLGWQTRLRSWRQHRVFNGSISCQLQRHRVDGASQLGDAPKKGVGKDLVDKRAAPTLNEREVMIRNRLEKNSRRLASLLKSLGHSPYRIYDRDLPEYAFLVDCYPVLADKADASPVIKLQLQEYSAPATVSVQKAREREKEFVNACQSFFDVARDDLVVKKRERKRGKTQYDKAITGSSSPPRLVRERDYFLHLNLDAYLDTGLFIDSRGVRDWIAKHARGKTFLNLFAYTGTATLAAVKGGARASLSLDLSATYMDWAVRNFDLNQIDRRCHQVRRVDCLDWLSQSPTARYDLVLLDPPSFSNSKRMQQTLDVQRDHVTLLMQAMNHVKPDGHLVFCVNKRNFKLDRAVEDRFEVSSMTGKTLMADCQGSSQAHSSWLLKHRIVSS